MRNDTNPWTNSVEPPQPAGDESGRKKPSPRGLKEGVEVNTGGKNFETVVIHSLEKQADKLAVMQLKPTFAEYIKLLELAREMKLDSVRKEIEYKWIGPDEDWSEEE